MKGMQVSERNKQYKACAGCGKRSENCHGTCEEYAKEVILGAILESIENKEKAQREDEYLVRETKALRISKSCPGAKKTMQKNGYMKKRGR